MSVYTHKILSRHIEAPQSKKTNGKPWIREVVAELIYFFPLLISKCVTSTCDSLRNK